MHSFLVNSICPGAVSWYIEVAIIDSDAKVCVDALTSPSSAIRWRISILTQDTLRLKSSSCRVEFKWTPRDSNSAARVLASWSLCNKFSGCFVLGSAPEVFVDVIVKEQTQLAIL